MAVDELEVEIHDLQLTEVLFEPDRIGLVEVVVGAFEVLSQERLMFGFDSPDKIAVTADWANLVLAADVAEYDSARADIHVA